MVLREGIQTILPWHLMNSMIALFQITVSCQTHGKLSGKGIIDHNSIHIDQDSSFNRIARG